MGADALPGRGKLLQQHKAELRTLKSEAKKALSKAKSKEDKAAAENKYAEIEQQLLQRQHQQLQALAAAAEEDSGAQTPEAGTASAAATAAESQITTAPKSQPAEAEKNVISSLEALSLYGTNGDNRKPSKAQRRREKKQQEMKDREKMLEEARAADTLGPLEWARLEEALQKEGFSICSIPGDGHCLFRAILHQLQQDSPQPEVAFDLKGLRGGIADLMLRERDSFKPFLDEELQQDAAFEAFCENIQNSQDWGGEIELHAASKLLQRPIQVFSLGDDVCIITYGEEYKENPPIRLVFHRHLLASGPHYNSVIPRAEPSTILG